jgi:hypothetical protein
MCEIKQNLTNNAENTIEQPNKPKKRGRKPNPDKKSGYFYEEEEKAFKEYVESNDQRFRDRIFREKLYPAFTKMIESIIRRYGLFTPSEDFSDTFNDTLSFLITKVNNFDFSKGYKAYSYCGTVCKRYLLLKRTQDMKKRDTLLSYDLMFGSGGDNRSDYDKEQTMIAFNTELISRNIEKIQHILSPENNEKLTDKERQVGYALLEILMNWEQIFSNLSTDNKFNKTSFLYFVKEYTQLSTKDVRDAMKKYKDIYFTEKQNLIQE